MAHVSLIALAVLFVACGPSDAPSSPDGAVVIPGDDCTAACPDLATCSPLTEVECAANCSCDRQRWKSSAFDDYVGCIATCGVGNHHLSCVTTAAGAQPTFSDGAYRSNCEAKVSACPSYDSAACDPVVLAVLSSASVDLLRGCLGLPCNELATGAPTCVQQVLECTP